MSGSHYPQVCRHCVPEEEELEVGWKGSFLEQLEGRTQKMQFPGSQGKEGVESAEIHLVSVLHLGL